MATPSRNRVRRRLAAIVSAAALAGCSVSQPAVPVQRYLAGDFETVRTFAAEQAADGPAENLALVLNVEAQCQLALGDVDAARRTFERAAQVMGTWATGGGEATGAILGSESSKTYKGDPYEKAMNAFYLSFCYLQKGEPDNARAALKRGILMDAEVADEKYQADNALLFWMAGRMSQLMGSPDAEGFFDEARTAHEFALAHGARGRADPEVLAEPERGNLVVLLPTGLGPLKYGDGSQDELARFRPQDHPAAAAELYVDGESVGRSAILCDVYYQAVTLGGTEMEGIRKGKAVLKTSTTIAGGVLLSQAVKNRNRNSDAARAQAIAGGVLLAVGLLTSASADVRHWPTLPSTVQVVAADVPPGEHDVRVEFLDASGRAIAGLRHEQRVQVPESGERWLLVPSLPPPRAAFTGEPANP